MVSAESDNFTAMDPAEADNFFFKQYYRRKVQKLDSIEAVNILSTLVKNSTRTGLCCCGKMLADLGNAKCDKIWYSWSKGRG